MGLHEAEPLHTMHTMLCLNHYLIVIGLINFLCLFLLVFLKKSFYAPDRLWGELVIVSLWESQ